ncbi:E3 ubiquitin-protein ligase UPL4 isoform X2 [Jatropha curcas]|uniref:E3 ubiquitin-protein ligase UPL4 isoform X1 n=1 Tax=Jatropha curcas TaxID=180498 RepID=UPI0005FBEE2C|nr:E3 ubiquitin-protein ligase UPL4 isoform X1 [Jatropha curcas]XP_037494359.1 E3 ubiquitin-protein ligase UPL4 isoform X2 [Jatropha curcas]
MGNRGQKRAEIIEEFPADKRACSSLEFRPSSSNSSIQTNINSISSTPETRDAGTHDADMDTSSSGSASSRSEEEDHERDSAYGSCDSDEAIPGRSSLHNYQRQRSFGDHGRLRSALSTLSEGTESSGLLAALTELCEVLSFCTEDSLSSMMADSLSPVLVQHARHESNPDIMLLAIRALTYLCDVFPRASAFLVRHDAVPVLCQRLMAIEYLDVAEQCLQALEKISREQPLACLQAGAIMAVLNFIDFFSTSVQRVALSTVVNICKKLPTESPSPFMEAVPTLCNLLQYEDRQLVENVVICLMKIAERVSQSSEMLDDLCKHGLINEATHLIHLNSRTTLSQPIYNGLIGLLVKLASGSMVAFRTLYELNISSTLKDMLATYDASHGMSSLYAVDGQSNQVHEVLKLLNELLPLVPKDHDVQQEVSEKESFLVNHPELLRKFGSDMLPMLIQVVNSGANIYVCFGCLSVINKLVYFSKSDILVELFKNANIPSFLAGVFTRKDHHVLILALQIAEIILQKLSDIFLNAFIKEGVFFAIDALMMPEKCSPSMFPVFNSIQLTSDFNQKSVSKVVRRCLCYAFDTGQSSVTSEAGTCKLVKDGVQSLAKHIKTTYFAPELCDFENGLTDILQKLRALSASLSDLMNFPTSVDSSSQDEEKFYCLLRQIMDKLDGREPVSTFEFIESGIVKSLVKYISNGQYLSKVELHGKFDHYYLVEKRLKVFARFFSSYSSLVEGLPVSILIRKLQSALASLENFPVILSHSSKQRNWFATVPNGRCISHPCLRVRFVRGEGETCISDYSDNVFTVDPFSSLDAIEGFLFPRVRMERTKQTETTTLSMDPMESIHFQIPSSNSCEGQSSGATEPDSNSTDLHQMQEDEAPLEQVINLQPQIPGDTTTSDDGDIANPDQVGQFPSVEDINGKTGNPASSSNGDALPKLAFYLEGQELDRSLTLYQAILQQRIKADLDINTGAKLWSQVYTLTYRIAAESNGDSPKKCHSLAQNSSLVDKIGAHMQCTSFCTSIFNCELASDLDKLSPAYDVLFLLKSLEGLNRYTFHLMSCERVHAFAEGLINDLDSLKVVVHSVSQNEFVSSKLTEKLEQQMRDSFAVSIGGMPLWCNQLMSSCPFLFSFEARCKYFRLSAFGSQQVQMQTPSNTSGVSRDRRSNLGTMHRKKFLVLRDRILESAAQMMDLYAHVKVPIEVVYNEEVGSGLGPTLEFYTLVSHEFQKYGLGMWREDHSSLAARKGLSIDDSEILTSPFGLFPRPWPSTLDISDGIQFSDVIKKFVLLGEIVAKALQDGRVLDLPFSKAFYKLILQQELNLCDIQSFDPDLGRTLLEFEALVDRKKILESVLGENLSSTFDASFRSTRIEDLYLDFTLPGYPNYIVHPDHKLVNMDNLEEYVSLVVDATTHAGISRQVEAFKSGFNQVFPIKYLQIFTEEELERLLCGERVFWAFNELLDHIKFDHGYTASSPPINNLLEIMQEFNQEQRRAFLQFVTGAPRLPPGGLASLSPKLTIVRKHCSNCADADLPSVMTCANYLKLPPYSSKDKMKEKLLYAITEGQGSFHLS